MKKQDKEKLTKKINEYMINSGYTFRFSKTGDLDSNTNGKCNPNTKEIIIKSNSHAKTIAHELAHVIQFNIHGDSACSTSGNLKLASEHAKYEEQVYYTLRQLNIAQEWNKAVGYYPY